MTTAFLSKEYRQHDGRNDGPGPGEYSYDPRTIKNKPPSFAPFTTTSKRSDLVNVDRDIPGAGTYSLGGDFALKTSSGSGLKSKTKRFTDDPRSDLPGPGDYVLGSTLKNGRPKDFAKPAKVFESLLNLPLSPTVPAIPARHQSYGYEPNAKGRLTLQDPLIPGFAGTKNDAVGPADYDPKIDSTNKYMKAPAPTMKGSTRDGLNKLMEKAASMPGPGYYNISSDFTSLSKDMNPDDSNFVLRLAAARKKLSSSFASETKRDSLLKEALAKNVPGPASYQLPPSIQQPKPKPAELQYFTSCEERFKDPVPRSMRLHTAPGSYSPLVSDFDIAKIKVLKKKKMVSRSGWAQNVAFDVTERRFSYRDPLAENPAPGTYQPKTNISDAIPKQNVRAGPFGSNKKRFEVPKPAYIPTKEQIAARDIEQELFGDELRERKNMQMQPLNNRPKYTAVFASKEKRLHEEKVPDGPPPGAYLVQQSWTKGSAVLAPPSVISRKRPEISPGPMAYELPSTLIKKGPNRKNIMISTGTRGEKYKSDGPSPGAYDPIPMHGSMIKQSFNVLLSDQY